MMRSGGAPTPQGDDISSLLGLVTNPALLAERLVQLQAGQALHDAAKDASIQAHQDVSRATAVLRDAEAALDGKWKELDKRVRDADLRDKHLGELEGQAVAARAKLDSDMAELTQGRMDMAEAVSRERGAMDSARAGNDTRTAELATREAALRDGAAALEAGMRAHNATVVEWNKRVDRVKQAWASA